MNDFNSFKKKYGSIGISDDELMRKYMLRMLEEDYRAFEAAQNAEASATAVSASAAAAGGQAPSAPAESGSLITQNLVLRYDVGDPLSYPGSGNVVANLIASSGSAYNLIAYNSPAYSSSNGGTLILDGADDFLVASSTIDIYNSYGSQPPSLFDPSTTDFSMGIWFRSPSSLASSLSLFDIAGNGGGSMLMFVEPNGRLEFIHRQTGTWANYSEVGTLPGVIGTDQWYYAVYTKSGTTVKFYVNGQLVHTDSQTISQSYTYHIAVGVFLDYHAVCNVTFAEAQLYTIALSGAQVQSNFNYAKAKFGL